MAVLQFAARPVKRSRTGKKLILPKRGGKRREKTASLACYSYQKRELQKRARAMNCSVSYYLNHLLWQNWL